MEEEKWRLGTSPGSGVGLLGSFLSPGRTHDCNLSTSSFQRHALSTSHGSPLLSSAMFPADLTSRHPPNPGFHRRSWSHGSVQRDLLPQPQRARSAYVGVFRHAPCSRGLKDMLWEPSFSAARPALTQMDLARQMRFRSRHVDQRELQMLPAMLYREYLAKSRERPPPPPSSHDKDEQIFCDDETLEAAAREEGCGSPRSDGQPDDRCVICIELFTPWDIVRELPTCKHVFHKRCIDLWLRGVCSFEACYTRSCPTCKTPLDFQQSPLEADEEGEGLGGAMAHGAAAAGSGAPPASASSFAAGVVGMGVAPHAQAQAQAGMSFMSVLCGAIPQIPRWAYARAGDALLRDGQAPEAEVVAERRQSGCHGSAPPCCELLSRALLQ